MELKLPGEKLKKIRSEAKKLMNQQQVSGLMLSRLLGKMNAATQAIPMAPLFYRHLQSCLRETLRDSQEYESTTCLTPEAEELHWWVEHFTNWNGRSLIAHNKIMTIENDASTLGWGATCGGARTGGPWSRQEQMLHINCLELLAATLAVKCQGQDSPIHLAKDGQCGSTVLHQQ